MKIPILNELDNSARFLEVEAEAVMPIETERLSVWYGKQQAVFEVSVSFPGRGITAVIGPSGCGKSTLLRTLNRIADEYEDVRYEGSVKIDGIDILKRGVDLGALRRKLGLLLQRPFPLPMSIFDNVAYGLRLQGCRSRSVLADKVEHFLRICHLWNEVEHKLKGPTSALSVGQQQRLCLARGLAVEPEMILADEATSALDPISTRSIEELMMELKERIGIIWVTHTLRQAKRIADRAVFLYMGRLVECGDAPGFFDSPREDLTAEYLGGAFS